MIPEKDWSWVSTMKEAFLTQAPIKDETAHKTEKNFRPDLGDRAMDTVLFDRSDREQYIGEVGKKDGDYIYHFYPKGPHFPYKFKDKLGDAFLAIFRIENRLSWNHDELYVCTKEGCGFKGKQVDLRPEVSGSTTWFVCPDCGGFPTNKVLDSWSVRAQGFAANPMADELASKLFPYLDSLLEPLVSGG